MVVDLDGGPGRRALRGDRAMAGHVSGPRCRVSPAWTTTRGAGTAPSGRPRPTGCATPRPAGRGG
jgi:hypothetical protein